VVCRVVFGNVIELGEICQEPKRFVLCPARRRSRVNLCIARNGERGAGQVVEERVKVGEVHAGAAESLKRHGDRAKREAGAVRLMFVTF